MDDVDTHYNQYTPPPSPYRETNWDLNLDQANDGLLNPKKKQLSYLELYFHGFMEFVDEPSSPEMSDDETEYPRWSARKSVADPSPSTTASIAKAPLLREPSIARDFSKPDIYSSPRITAPSNHDNRIVDYPELSVSHTSLPSPTHSDSESSKSLRKHKHVRRRNHVVGKARVCKNRASSSMIRKRSRTEPRRRSAVDSIGSMQ